MVDSDPCFSIFFGLGAEWPEPLTQDKESEMGRIFVRMSCLMLLGICSVASAAPRPRPWASMLLTGYVDISPDGSVRDYAMDHPEKIPPAVRGVVKQTVSGWRFKVKVTGKVIARARMSLRMVAKPLDRMKYSVGVEGVQFADDSAAPAATLYERKTTPPHYPADALSLRTAANVYVVVRIGRDGRVVDAGAEQVNLTTDCPPMTRAALENQFANASVRAVRQWTFHVPSTGPEANAPYWDARARVHFDLIENGGSVPSHAYGAWQPYLPGARRTLPWLKSKSMLASAPDAIPDGQPSLLDGAVQLAQNTK